MIARVHHLYFVSCRPIGVHVWNLDADSIVNHSLQHHPDNHSLCFILSLLENVVKRPNMGTNYLRTTLM